MASMNYTPPPSRRNTGGRSGGGWELGGTKKTLDKEYGTDEENAGNKYAGSVYSDSGDERGSVGCTTSAEHAAVIKLMVKGEGRMTLSQLQSQRLQDLESEYQRLRDLESESQHPRDLERELQRLRDSAMAAWTKVDKRNESLLDKLLSINYKSQKCSRMTAIQLSEFLAMQEPQLLTMRKPLTSRYQTTTFYLGFNSKNGKPILEALLKEFLQPEKGVIRSYDILAEKCGEEDDTCLHIAVMKMKPESLIDLLLSDKSPISSTQKRNLVIQQDKYGLTPLHIAVSLNMTPETKEIIIRMVNCCQPDDLLIQDHEGRTPLHLAAACADNTLKARITSKEIREKDNPDHKKSHMAVLKILVKKQPKALRRLTKSGQRSPYQYRLSMSNSKNIGHTSGSGSSMQGTGDRISFYLIDQYMHLESDEEIISYLYGAYTSKFDRKIIVIEVITLVLILDFRRHSL